MQPKFYFLIIFETLFQHLLLSITLQLFYQIINIILLSNPDRLVIKLLLNCLLIKIMVIDLRNLLIHLKLQNFFIIKKAR